MEEDGVQNRNADLSPEQKEAASFLRERFLYLTASLPARPSKLVLYNKTDVSAQIRAFDSSFETVLVENLKPANSHVIPRALLRTSDIMTISYKGD